MSNVNPFKQSGQWYRGNTHSHSTESDGRLPMADRFAAYREAGYNFLVLTDHRKVNDVSAHSRDNFLAIPGSEVHPNNPYGGDTYHIVGINLHERINCAELHPNAVIEEINRQGGAAVLCHPYWCGHTLLDYLPLNGYFAVEVYNDTCMGIGRGFSEQAWDDLLDKAGRPVFGIAADDAHGTEHDCFHGWVMVKATELTTDAIMTAIPHGCFLFDPWTGDNRSGRGGRGRREKERFRQVFTCAVHRFQSPAQSRKTHRCPRRRGTN